MIFFFYSCELNFAAQQWWRRQAQAPPSKSGLFFFSVDYIRCLEIQLRGEEEAICANSRFFLRDRAEDGCIRHAAGRMNHIKLRLLSAIVQPLVGPTIGKLRFSHARTLQFLSTASCDRASDMPVPVFNCRSEQRENRAVGRA